MLPPSKIVLNAPKVLVPVVGLRLLRGMKFMPKIFREPQPKIQAGKLLSRTPAYKTPFTFAMVKQLAAVYPKESSPYSPTRFLNPILGKLTKHRDVMLLPSYIVPDDISDFQSDNYFGWASQRSRLFFQSCVWINHPAREARIIGECSASIATTMINNNGDINNLQALWVPGSGCEAFCTQPEYYKSFNRWVWYEGIKGQFAGQEFVPYLYQEIAPILPKTPEWYVDLRELEEQAVALLYKSVEALIPSPSIIVENTFVPSNEEGTEGWLYVRVRKTRFPDFVIGTKFSTEQQPDPPADVQVLLTQYKDPAWGVALPNKTVLMSYKLENGLFVPFFDSSVLEYWLEEANQPLIVSMAKKSIELYPKSGPEGQ